MEVADVWRSGSRRYTSPRRVLRLDVSFVLAIIWLYFLPLYLFPIYSRASLLLWHPPAPSHTHTHRRTNAEDERRRVAPLPALQQVAQTNWQQQNGPEKAFFFSLRDLSAVLTSNFIFIDTAYFLPSGVWQPGGWVCGWGGIWYPPMHHQSGQYASVTEEQIHAFLKPSIFWEINFCYGKSAFRRHHRWHITSPWEVMGWEQLQWMCVAVLLACVFVE